MDSFLQGLSYEDLPSNILVSTTHRPRTPTTGILSSNVPALIRSQGLSALIRPPFLRRNAYAYVVRNCCKEEMENRQFWGRVTQRAGLGDEFRLDLPDFKSVITRQSRARDDEELPDMRSGYIGGAPSMQRNPSLPRQRSRSQSRARTVVPGYESSPPVPALPDLRGARTALSERIEASHSIQRGSSFPRSRNRSRSRARTVLPGDEASPPVPALPSEHRAHTAALSIDTSTPAVSEENGKGGEDSLPDSAIDLSRDNSLSTQSTQQSLGSGQSSNAELRCVSTGETSITAVCSGSSQTNFPQASPAYSSVASSTHTIDFALPLIPSRPSITPMLAPTPTEGNLTLPEAALPPSQGRHVNFDASCSSRPQSCRLKTGFLNKIKNALHDVDKSIARFISRRKDKQYLCSQRKLQLANRKCRNKLLDSNNRQAINAHRQRNASMKTAIKAQKLELQRCKKNDKVNKRKAEKQQRWQEKREREEKKSIPLGREMERMFGWRLRVDGWVKWPVRRLGSRGKVSPY